MEVAGEVPLPLLPCCRELLERLTAACIRPSLPRLQSSAILTSAGAGSGMLQPVTVRPSSLTLGQAAGDTEVVPLPHGMDHPGAAC